MARRPARRPPCLAQRRLGHGPQLHEHRGEAVEVRDGEEALATHGEHRLFVLEVGRAHGQNRSGRRRRGTETLQIRLGEGTFPGEGLTAHVPRAVAMPLALRHLGETRRDPLDVIETRHRAHCTARVRHDEPADARRPGSAAARRHLPHRLALEAHGRRRRHGTGRRRARGARRSGRDLPPRTGRSPRPAQPREPAGRHRAGGALDLGGGPADVPPRVRCGDGASGHVSDSGRRSRAAAGHTRSALGTAHVRRRRMDPPLRHPPPHGPTRHHLALQHRAAGARRRDGAARAASRSSGSCARGRSTRSAWPTRHSACRPRSSRG